MFIKFPPVRRPVPLGVHRAGTCRSRSWGDVGGFRLFHSGTEALAGALSLASRRCSSKKPQAILPAYGCPDLVAACLHAGLEPRLVDVTRNAWGYDLQKLKSAINDNTAAIVAVNFLGVGDQSEILSLICRERGFALVQDSAQALPDQPGGKWFGDYIVFSFGRGKPLNLLGGGALLIPSDEPQEAHLSRRSESVHEKILFSLKAAAFNFVTHPNIYWLASKLPGLNLGDTSYSALAERRKPRLIRMERIESALVRYSSNTSYSATKWRSVIEDWRRMGIEPLRCMPGAQADDQYLRLPLLARSAEQRDRILEALVSAGLGASSMYGAPLNRIRNIPMHVAAQGPFPNAEDLASRLFTLPTYELVRDSVVRRTNHVLLRAAT